MRVWPVCYVLCAMVCVLCPAQALCGFLYEDEQNIIKEFEDDCSSQMRKVCDACCANVQMHIYIYIYV